MNPLLRFALHTAILIEKQSFDFYQYAARIVSNDKTRLLFKILASDEASHLRIFQEFYQEQEFGDLSRLLNHPPDLGTPVYRALLESIDANTQVKEALEISLREEEGCIEFYSGLIRSFKEPGLCRLFEQALFETRMHCKIIRAEYMRVTGMVGMPDGDTHAYGQSNSRIINLRREDSNLANRLTGNQRRLLPETYGG
ncbi:MAG: hypothetical protein FD174_4100 [Geobacteraceae bacterium]|nr:MAG: hypothetical protein FD174_4100 [Geobacteraceae bacterium]